MGRKAILIWSILAIIFVAVFNGLPKSTSVTPMPVLLIFLFGTIVTWIGVVYVVFTDAKSKKKSPLFGGLTLLTGGVGGLIYYFLSKK